MRIAVLSDIHSNMAALEAVLADVEALGADRVLSLGDNIGYGPEPEAVIRTLAENDISSVMGNHEQALLDNDVLNGFNPKAKKALKINKALLSIDSMRMITGFPTFMRCNNARFVHGVPPDVISQYVTKQSFIRLGHILDANPEQAAFVGHTHDLAVYEAGPNGVVRKKFWQERVSLAKNCKYIINSGSVGQPRGSHNEATYVLWDSNKRVVESRAVPYDTLRSIKLIKAAGIPDLYADLLKPGNFWRQSKP